MLSRKEQAAAYVVRSHSFKIWETLPWLACAAVSVPFHLSLAASTRTRSRYGGVVNPY